LILASHDRDCFASLAMTVSFVVMYGRPPLGKENLAASAMGLEQSCIRPVDAVG
jgi:hypothetical protein